MHNQQNEKGAVKLPLSIVKKTYIHLHSGIRNNIIGVEVMIQNGIHSFIIFMNFTTEYQYLRKCLLGKIP